MVSSHTVAVNFAHEFCSTDGNISGLNFVGFFFPFPYFCFAIVVQMIPGTFSTLVRGFRLWMKSYIFGWLVDGLSALGFLCQNKI